MPETIASLGEFGLIDRITGNFSAKHPQTLKGAGDDAAVIDTGKSLTLISTDLLLEGIHFDLIYTPLRHLGYKAVVVGISDIYAMNGAPRQITVSIGLSARFGVEQVDELYAGVKIACDQYEVDLVGGDTTASMTGLTLSVTAIGEVEKDKIVYRSGARENDLICVTGDLGSAYLGLKLLDREKRVLEGIENPQPVFDGYEYLLQRQLKPQAQRDVIEAMRENSLVPTAMIDLSDGLASDLLQLCKASKMGARVYLERIPIAKESFALAEELHIDPVVAALNGGDDYELLFTVPLNKQGEIAQIPGAEIIGHIVTEGKGAALTTPDGQEITLTAPGFGDGGR
ncbi:MAG: thiamine-phosphate kinase [Rikenellaceae bacterium]|jgi:thiamine-monophosphate kinase|nr:thiamine-phosphate kinase [Rikenellaceae bacterium]